MKRNFKKLSQIVVFLKLLLPISNTTKRANIFQRFLKVPMSPEVILKILTAGTAQVLISQNGPGCGPSIWPRWCKLGECQPCMFYPQPQPQPGPGHMSLSSNFHPPPSVPSWPTSHTASLHSPFPPDSPLLNPTKQSDNIGYSSEGSEQRD